MTDKTLGQILHEAREAGNDGRDRPMFLAAWAERDPRLQALDESMAEAVAAEVREQVAARMDELAANYPEDVFPADGTSGDAIGGAAMRHAYRNAARTIREETPDVR